MLESEVIQDHLVLEYNGARVESGRMDARRVATQILAFSDFLEVVSQSAYGQGIEVRTEIQGFRGESFDIDFLFHVVGQVTTLMSIVPAAPQDVIELIKQSITLWKHLGGKPPRAMNHAETGGQAVSIENNSGQVMVVNGPVINIVANARAGEAVEKFIREPLEVNGVESLTIRSPTLQQITRIEKKDAQAFIPVALEQPLGEVEIETHLMIESPTFKEGNKWRFSDGQTSFPANITDAEFLKAVNDGSARFGKGDTLKVRLLIQQATAAGKLSAERTVTKVLDHFTASYQPKLV